MRQDSRPKGRGFVAWLLALALVQAELAPTARAQTEPQREPDREVAPQPMPAAARRPALASWRVSGARLASLSGPATSRKEKVILGGVLIGVGLALMAGGIPIMAESAEKTRPSATREERNRIIYPGGRTSCGGWRPARETVQADDAAGMLGGAVALLASLKIPASSILQESRNT
jgi:hypothetical protein